MTTTSDTGALAEQSNRADVAAQAVRAAARVARLLERWSGDLTLAQYRVLSAVAGGSARASHVAQRLAVGKPTVSAAVEALCERDLLLREGVAGDQRATALSVTAAGRRVLDSVETVMIDHLTALCSRTPDPGRVLEALAWMGEALDAATEERMAHYRPPEA